MHSGQLATLEDVVSFYNDANQEPLIGHRDELIVPLGLTTVEQAAMVLFSKVSRVRVSSVATSVGQPLTHIH